MTENEMKNVIMTIMIAMIIAGPFATIWALNTIFALMIPYNITTWFAMLWIGIVINGSPGASFKSK